MNPSPQNKCPTCPANWGSIRLGSLVYGGGSGATPSVVSNEGPEVSATTDVGLAYRPPRLRAVALLGRRLVARTGAAFADLAALLEALPIFVKVGSFVDGRGCLLALELNCQLPWGASEQQEAAVCVPVLRTFLLSFIFAIFTHGNRVELYSYRQLRHLGMFGLTSVAAAVLEGCSAREVLANLAPPAFPAIMSAGGVFEWT